MLNLQLWLKIKVIKLKKLLNKDPYYQQEKLEKLLIQIINLKLGIMKKKNRVVSSLLKNS